MMTIQTAPRMLLWTGILLLTGVATTATASAQTAAAGPVFEVSTVKVNNSGSGSSHADFKDGQYVATNIALKNILHYQAYGVPEPRILGGPKWMDSTRFDIEAKADSSFQEHTQALNSAQRMLERRAMFQQFLASRFKLAVHWETRELPVYTLVVAKGGPKLHATTAATGFGTSAGEGRLKATAITMEYLAQTLTQELESELGRVVVDKTGLNGSYDLALKWTPADGASGDAADAGPSFFTALQEQAGLKLESAKGPVQVLVIDHVEMPTEN